MGEKLRLHLGGLGSNVQASDLHKTFTSPQLGEVQSVEIIRTKGRSFAYIELNLPDFVLGLNFFYYNGCMWKGGRLKLEKAKEDYQCRLRREWMEAAQHETKLPNQSIDADESVCEMPKPKKEDIEKMQLKLFFPKLRKLKVIPLKGTGKHKYSFQRIEVPPLPTHFCDCEEHFVPPEPAKRNHSGLPMPAKRNKTNDHEVDNNGVNEEELNMMKSILDKLLEKEIRSEIVSNEAEPSEEIQHDASLADQCQVDDNEEDKESEEDEEDQESDEDNLVINIVGRSSKRGKLFEDWGQKTSITNQDSLVNEPEALNNTNDKKQEMQRANQIFDNKRKQSVREGKPNDTVPSKKKRVMEIYHDGTGDQVVKNTKPVDKDPGSIRLGSDVAITEKKSSDVASSTKSAWKALQDQSSKDEELKKHSDALSTEQTASEDLLARGASWKRKSSWLQMVADANASAFSLSQVLPDVTFQKQEPQQFKVIDFSSSSRVKQDKFLDKKSFAEDIGEPQRPANTRNLNEDVLTKEQNTGGPVGEQLNSHLTAPVLGVNLVPSNRPMGEIIISETCPFMKSADSMKEWAKSKAALSGSHKRKGKEMDSLQKHRGK
ncbi:hypothetical protein SASPL_151829 [Salvia splendens]|uniref:RRM domain-containing protein n=1 Tax=Salvia splendens TaxID=180675 RepID=A0A8X8W237_SALSN|nr:hypothetical protein SASPL_151829 [Salvia splendens]